MRPETERALIEHMRNQDVAIAALTAEIQLLRGLVEGRIRTRKFLSLEEAAEVVHVGKTTMYERLRKGQYPFAVQHGRRWLIPYDELVKCV